MSETLIRKVLVLLALLVGSLLLTISSCNTDPVGPGGQADTIPDDGTLFGGYREAKLAYTINNNIYLRDLISEEDSLFIHRDDLVLFTDSSITPPAALISIATSVEQFSPDGSQLLINASPVVDGGFALTINLLDKSYKLIRTESSNIVSPKWGPDGELITYSGAVGPMGLNFEIFITDLLREEGARFTNHPSENDMFPSFTRAGNSLIFLKKPTDTSLASSICKIKLDGTDFQILADHTHIQFRKITRISLNPRRDDLLISGKKPENNVMQLGRVPALNFSQFDSFPQDSLFSDYADWSNDGEIIFFLRGSEPLNPTRLPYALWAMRKDGSRLEKLLDDVENKVALWVK